MAIILSGQQFLSPEFPERIAAIPAETGLAPFCLDLELTENQLMHNLEMTQRTLRGLAVLGVRFSMDDFGTGYSSLNYLKRFPIDVLKIDRAFVRDIVEDPDDAAIVKAIIAMAHSLKTTVTAPKGGGDRRAARVPAPSQLRWDPG